MTSRPDHVVGPAAALPPEPAWHARGDVRRRTVHALPAGTVVLTARGERRVEDVELGERVVTRDIGLTPVRMIVQAPPCDLPTVTIPAHALGRGRPARDVVLPAAQPIVIRDARARILFDLPEVRLAAGRIADGRVVRALPAPPVAWYTLALDRPGTIYADGLEVVAGHDDPVDDGF